MLQVLHLAHYIIKRYTITPSVKKPFFLHLRVSPQNRQNNGTQTAGLETGILRRLYYDGTMVKNCFFDTTNKE